MPACVLRIRGTFAKIDLLSVVPLPRVTRAEDGCVLALVSSDENADLSIQISEAQIFLARFGEALDKAAERYSLHMELDFGVWLTGTFVQSVRLPPALMSAAGNVGIVLCISLYDPGEKKD